MKKFFVAHLLILLFFAINIKAQDAKESLAINYIDGLLQPGSHKVEILEKDISADLRKIVLQYRQSVSEHMEWFSQYSQNYAGTDPLPYHENFGITADEYERMNNEFPRLKMKVKTVKTVEIDKENNKINFKGNGNFTIFDAIVVDVNNKVIIIDEQLIPFSGEVNEAETSEFGSWTGYRWKLEVGSMEDIKAFKETDYTMIDIAIGKTLATNKTIIQYKTIYVEGGSPKINGALTAYLN